MSERKSLSGGDWLALATFFVGAAVAVLVTYGLLTGVGGSAGTGAMAAAIAGFVGPWPALIGGAGVALLGARAFLVGERRRMIPSVLGVLGVAAGLSVVAGSLSVERGGTLGAMTGGRVAEMSHAAVGVLLGAIVAFAAAYLAWMREDPAAAAKLAPARRATPAPPKGDDGVTAAESAMLFEKARAAEADEDEVAPARPIAPPAKPVKPLYPEDVRLKGEIPAGTRPLAGASALAATTPLPAAPEPAVYRWTAPRADPTRMAPEEIEALADVAPPIPERELEADAQPEVVALASVVEDAVEETEPADERPMPPRPTWETTGLAEDDEPVDAYGTPLSLVERARRDRDDDAPVVTAPIPREIGAISDAQAEVEAEREAETEALELEPVEEEDVLAEEQPAVILGAVVETEVEAGDAPVAIAAEPEPVEMPRSLLEELRASNALARAEAELDAEMDELEEEVAAVAPDADADLEEALDELDEEEQLADAPFEAVVAAVAAPVEEAPEEDEVEEEELEPEPAVAVADEADEEEAEEAPAPPPTPAPAPRAKAAAVASPSLFDAVAPEREVVLQPQAPVPASRAEKAPGRGIDPEKKLLVEVGCMFVERGRVAVSMLQRQYDMDFDQACRVLDDLQEMGLIGPYMGGKNRDILLTKEQWLDKVGAAAS